MQGRLKPPAAPQGPRGQLGYSVRDVVHWARGSSKLQSALHMVMYNCMLSYASCKVHTVLDYDRCDAQVYEPLDFRKHGTGTDYSTHVSCTYQYGKSTYTVTSDANLRVTLFMYLFIVCE